MATNTKNYNLIKPSQEDFYNIDDINNNMDTIDEELNKVSLSAADLSNNKLDKTGNLSETSTAFEQADIRENIYSGEKSKVILGKIKKWFSDIRPIAFSASYKDLVNTPTTFPPSTHNHDSTYLKKVENAVSATKLQTPRNINGVEFDGSRDITLLGHSNSTVTHLDSVLPSNNLNDLGVSGTFMGKELVNAPQTGWWYVESLIHDDKYSMQIAYPLHNKANSIYTRLKINSVWNGWNEIYTNVNLTLATTTLKGLMSSTDKAKLDGVDSKATANVASVIAPKANGTATAGSATSYTREDHVHPAQTAITGNSGTATKLQTARKINGVGFDGSKDITLPYGAVTALLTPGTHTSVNNQIQLPLTEVINIGTFFVVNQQDISIVDANHIEISCSLLSGNNIAIRFLNGTTIVHEITATTPSIMTPIVVNVTSVNKMQIISLEDDVEINNTEDSYITLKYIN